MLTVEGVYKNGKVELLGDVPALADTKVLVTFLNNSDVSLKTLNIDEAEAAELKDRLATFDDWNDPALDIYNDYDNAKSALGEKA
jgi:hypothetical protein